MYVTAVTAVTVGTVTAVVIAMAYTVVTAVAIAIAVAITAGRHHGYFRSGNSSRGTGEVYKNVRTKCLEHLRKQSVTFVNPVTIERYIRLYPGITVVLVCLSATAVPFLEV